MSEIKTLLKQSSHYLAGRIIILSAGFISFPILTRIFSVSDYGMLGLISTTIFIMIAVAKLGFPESIVRFYAEFKSKNRGIDFYSTMFLSSVGIGAIIAILVNGVTQLVSNKLDKDVVNLMPFVSILVFTGCINVTLTSFLRAEQKTKLWNFIDIMHRYGAVALGILFVFFLIKGLYGFYIGHAIAGIGMLFFLWFFYRNKINLKTFSFDILKNTLKFGFPLIWAELGHLVLNYADRYMIQIYLGAKSLGLYTAGYNLSTYVTEMVMYPVNYAMAPIFMNILVNKGEEETKIFFTRTLNVFLLIMFPVVFGFLTVGRELLTFLASSKYAEAGTILYYVAFGQFIYACSVILNNGLFIRKKTHIITITMFISCALNIGLNLILIPRFGIVGAAQATLVSNLFYTVLVVFYSFRVFSFRIDYQPIILYFASSVIMFIVVEHINWGTQFGNIIMKVGIGIVVYCWLIVMFDKNIRYNTVRMIKALKI